MQRFVHSLATSLTSSWSAARLHPWPSSNSLCLSAAISQSATSSWQTPQLFWLITRQASNSYRSPQTHVKPRPPQPFHNRLAIVSSQPDREAEAISMPASTKHSLKVDILMNELEARCRCKTSWWTLSRRGIKVLTEQGLNNSAVWAIPLKTPLWVLCLVIGSQLRTMILYIDRPRHACSLWTRQVWWAGRCRADRWPSSTSLKMQLRNA